MFDYNRSIARRHSSGRDREVGPRKIIYFYIDAQFSVTNSRNTDKYYESTFHASIQTTVLGHGKGMVSNKHKCFNFYTKCGIRTKFYCRLY